MENGISAVTEKEWILLERGLEEGHSVVITYTMELECKVLPDNVHACALFYGRYVLSGDMGKGENRKKTYYRCECIGSPERNTASRLYCVKKKKA